MGYLAEVWAAYSPTERRNIALYILGIMFYKFGLEAFNGSITTLATDRFKEGGTFQKLGILQGLNQAFQCVGSILIAPLIKKWPTRSVLGLAVMTFGLLTMILLIVDKTTGGSFRKGGKKNNYGHWNPDILFPVYSASGIAYGMVELIRRVIPRDIVGGDVNKLRRMDAIVHIFYEVSGTAGAISTTYLVLSRGNNYSFMITPIFFAIACIIWFSVSTLGFKKNGESEMTLEGMEVSEDNKNYLLQVGEGFVLFGRSIYRGGRIIFSGRRYVWLVFGYSIALYGHRYLENAVAPLIGKKVFFETAYSQILVSGSNLGELLGALSVFLLNDAIPTPIPWLRMDALLVLIVWALPYYHPPASEKNGMDVKYAWRLAAVFMPISYGWAAGDVSLAAYIQASLARKEGEDKKVSALGAVMAFLYSIYIILYAILSWALGKSIDKLLKQDSSAKKALTYLGGVHFTIIGAVVLISTFVPKGALRLNPALLFGEDLTGEISSEDGDLKKDVDLAGPMAVEKERADVGAAGAEMAAHHKEVTQ